VKDEPAGGAPCVDRLGQGPELDAAVGQALGEIQQVVEGAAQAVEPPDCQDIARTDELERFIEAGALSFDARDRIGEDLLASGRLERIVLEGVMLIGGRDARVTHEHRTF
jgi:hypothetical protein